MAILRRGPVRLPDTVRLENIELDRYTLQAQCGNFRLDLMRRETSLLEYLMQNPNQIATRDMIAEHVWETRVSLHSNVLEVFCTDC